jgi:hypothetical protein
LTDSDAIDPAPESSRSLAVAGIRLLVLAVVFVVLPMLLLAAMVPPQGCGGG